MMDIDDVIEILAIELIGVVPDDQEVIVATNKGEPVVFDRRTRSGQAYYNIVRRLEGEDVPFMQLGQDGLVDRLRRLFGRDAAPEGRVTASCPLGGRWGDREMLDFFGRLFGRDEGSKKAAKDRLRLVLVHDRASLVPAADGEPQGRPDPDDLQVHGDRHRRARSQF